MSESVPASEGSDNPPVDVRLVRGTPSEEELAALVAVVSSAYLAEPAAEPARATVRSRWELSARGLRAPLARERGWGGFGG